MELTSHPLLHTLYSMILFLSLLFLMFFFYSIKTYNRKDRIPIVYIYVMIISNFIELLIEVFNDVIPLFLTAQTYGWLRQFMGEYTTLLDDFSYAFPMFLTVVMVAERFYVVFRPRGELFSDRKLWFYCLLLAIFTMVFCIIPFFSGCPINYDFYTFTYESQCEHIFTYLFDKYNGVIPLVCMFLNIGLILNLSCKRRKSRNTNDAVTIARRSHEKTMLIQSVLSTAFLLSYEITESIINIYFEEYMKFSELTRRSIYYSRNVTVALRCFFIYFIGTPAIRTIIIDKAIMMVKKKKRIRVVVITSSRDQSVF
ncbi:hypothetical protein CRE_05441 [Caenorhabditis remanei]|uniref:G-protein coupled receptors family 1 profile domain-containing protein n=1 Tax=Caenorhabditis remanei TaxID=31234 RepID=E3M0J3_CAERE|nr:hypothetical protein CRE_05441 [Caenorhabditis remanei]